MTVSIKDFSRKQRDPFLNYWTWTLGTELICKSMLRDSFGVCERSGATAESRCGAMSQFVQRESNWATKFGLPFVAKMFDGGLLL